jgi:hypothetical protein
MTTGASGTIQLSAKPEIPGVASGLVSIDGADAHVSQIVWP